LQHALACTRLHACTGQPGTATAAQVYGICRPKLMEENDPAAVTKFCSWRYQQLGIY